MIYGTHPDFMSNEDFGGPAYNSLDDLPQTVADAITHLAPVADDFDVIVCRGTSGIVVGVPVALALEKPIAILRKPNDGSHSSDEWIGRRHILGGARVLFLDDRIATGKTRRACIDACVEEGSSITLQYLYDRTGSLTSPPFATP